MKHQVSTSWARAIVCGVGIAALSATGCQVQVGGQTLPSGHYLTDDVQYFAPGPEMKLSREAAAMKAYEADQDAQSP
ncbi:MAG: hypothetical protein O3C40_20035 [Planctomycetota bacterium]|nr:hypothetical protein [Planctomycetota bacterium]